MLRDEYNKRYSLPLTPSKERGNYEQPIVINSGLGMEQLLRYAVILLDISDESQEDFDELLMERNAKGTYWLHFAVRPEGNRRKIRLIAC